MAHTAKEGPLKRATFLHRAFNVHEMGGKIPTTLLSCFKGPNSGGVPTRHSGLIIVPSPKADPSAVTARASPLCRKKGGLASPVIRHTTSGTRSPARPLPAGPKRQPRSRDTLGQRRLPARRIDSST